MKIILQEEDIKNVMAYLEALQYKIAAPLIGFLNSKVVEESDNNETKDKNETKEKVSKK